MAVINPYQEIIKQIEQKSQLDEQRANNIAEQQQQQAYVGYMTAKKDLGETLASQGIQGGGTESATLGANTGYQRQRNAVNSNRASEVNAIRQNRTANRSATQSQAAQWENDQQALAEQRFANTLTGFDTVAKVDNAIAVARASGETWKVDYLMAQRAALVERDTASQEASYTPTYTAPITPTPLNQSDDITAAGYTSSAPLSLSVPAYQRPIVAGYINPVNPYTAVSTKKITAENPYLYRK